MGKIFIAHAWSNDENYNQKQLDFIRKLELELQDNNLEVIYDGNNVDKKGLNSFMRENIKNCDVILAICDEIYLQKSDNEDTGVYYELQEIAEHKFLDKVIPIKIAQCKLPYLFGSLEYESFQNEFDNMVIDSTDALKKLFVRLSKKLSMPTLCPNDSLKPDVMAKINSSEHFDEYIEEISCIISNLDIEENGHISIFLAHHSKDYRLIQMLDSRLECTFSTFKEAKLNSEELGDFDKQVRELSDNIEFKIGNHSEERRSRLERQDKFEASSYQEIEEVHKDAKKEESRQNEVRCAIQTVEVIGVILKNRYGSIKNKDFDKILKNTVDANLRLLTSFIKIVSNQEFISLLENFISNEITSENVDSVKLKKEIHDMLVSMNFATIYAIILKTISSIGSEYISRYFSKLSNNSTANPSYILIKRGLEMQYEKQFAEDDILKEINDTEMSHLARTILNLLVVNHISTHYFNFKEKSRIEKKFGFRPNTILKREQQIKSLESR